MSKKTVVRVDLHCSKCRPKVMKLISTIEGIISIALDPSKGTVTVVGEADPVCIIKKVRKFRRCAEIISIGPAKDDKKEEPKDKDPAPKTCKVETKCVKEPPPKPCQKECQKPCQKACQNTCQKACQNTCQQCDVYDPFNYCSIL